MTADAAARGIRERDTRGSIGIIGAEQHPPYNRPPLTKGLWKGDAPDSIWRKTDEAKVDMKTGARATKVDPGARRVTDDKGETHQYKKLLLATGGTPRKLPGAADGVIYYRTLDDYRRTRELTDNSARFVVIGGGFIGTEIAAGIRMQKREVTMIVPEKGLGGRVFPADLSAFLVDYYREKGVEVHPSESVEKVETRS